MVCRGHASRQDLTRHDLLYYAGHTVSSQLSRQIGANLKAARDAKGLTQTELGQLIGRDGFQISRWERGAHRPTDASLMALGEALDMDYLAFFAVERKAA